MFITLQQALFGYEGGHQLIAASTALPTEAKHDLAVATDLSGSPPPAGFERAYTGMLVPGTAFYALFCTWLAPEMPRPGCVWSHVLLIELADMAQVASLAELRTLFRRPHRGIQQHWREPIPFTANQGATPATPLLPEAECITFLKCLYNDPRTPVVIASPASQTYEELVFALWSQQWPKLRRTFRFSTGSFADRGRSGAAFDLQITPITNTAAWQRPPQTLPLDVSEATATASKTIGKSWVRTALADLLAPDQHGFRSFLQTHGADVSAPRAAFSRLAAAFEELKLSGDREWSEKLRVVAELFPEREEAVRLKEAMVTPQESESDQERVAHAWQTAVFLFADPKADAYTGVTFDHSGVAPLLWREKRVDVIGLLGDLIRREENPTATAFVKAISNAVTASDLKQVSDGRSELIPLIISHHPALAFNPETWRLPGYVQSHIFDALDRLELRQQDWALILGAMFIAATYVSVRQAVEMAGPLAIQGAFRWLDDPIAEKYVPSDGWRTALAKSAEELLQTTDDLAPAPLALCAWCLSPDTARRRLSSSRPDMQRLAGHLNNIPRPLRTPTAFLLMMIGLRTLDRAGEPLITRTFFLVHEALATRSYESESWWLLSPELPFLGWWHDWDKCEKLRQAVRDSFQKNRRSAKALLTAATNEQERALALQVLEGKAPPSQDFLD